MGLFLRIVFLLLCCMTREVKAVEQIMVQSMSRLEGMERGALEKHRKQKMIYSSFYSYKYQPKIFEHIKGGEKWVGDKASCSRNRFNDGKSEASIWINNPNILVHLSGNSKYIMGTLYADVYNPVFCVYAEQLLFKPLKIAYDENKKEITTTYRAHNVLLGIGSHSFGALDFVFSPINAYDVGFNYYALVESKGIALGAEKAKGGLGVMSTHSVMNLCPHCYVGESESCLCYHRSENMLARLTSKRAEMVFKLWKEKPKSKDDKADFYYRVRFVE